MAAMWFVWAMGRIPFISLLCLHHKCCRRLQRHQSKQRRKKEEEEEKTERSNTWKQSSGSATKTNNPEKGLDTG